MEAPELERRERIDAVARSFLGTPFHDRGEVKGPNGGVDCSTFLKLVFVEAGAVAPFDIGPYSPQFFLHQSEERYLNFVLRFAREIAKEEAIFGDVVLYKIGRCFAHGAIILKPGWPHIIHAHQHGRRVREGDGERVNLGTRIRDVKFFSRW
jgi:cell wall-associated NlpC family hydrolase